MRGTPGILHSTGESAVRLKPLASSVDKPRMKSLAAIRLPSLRSASIAWRLALGFGSVLALLVAVAAVGTFALRGMSGQIRQIGEVNNRKIEMAYQMLAAMSDIAIQTRNITMMTGVVQIEEQTKLMQKAQDRYLAVQAGLTKVVAGDGGSAGERRLLEEIAASAAKTLPLFKEAAQQGGDGDSVSAVLGLTTKVQPEELLWRGRVQKLIDMQTQMSEQAIETASAQQKRAIAVQGVIVLASLAFGTLIAWAITRRRHAADPSRRRSRRTHRCRRPDVEGRRRRCRRRDRPPACRHGRHARKAAHAGRRHSRLGGLDPQREFGSRDRQPGPVDAHRNALRATCRKRRR